MKPFCPARCLSLLGLLCLLAVPERGRGADPRFIFRLGLYDAPYTSTNGQQVSYLNYLDRGYAAGTSLEYSATNQTGSAQWVADARTGVTTRVGFYGVDYTQSGGSQNGAHGGEIDALAGGYVAGASVKYSGTNFLGQATWVANAATGVTTRVGLFDAASTQSGGGQDGYQYSYISQLAGGYATGQSQRYAGTGDLGQAVWVANAATGVTTRLGYFDAGYTQSGGAQDGYQYSQLGGLVGGYVMGASYKYSGTTSLGQAAWVANPATGAMTRMGFTDANYTQTGGYQSSYVSRVAGGYTAGASEKYSGATDLGQVAWVAPLATAVPVRVGLTDAAYTSSSGFQFSVPGSLADGYLAGYSNKYSGANNIGQAAWVANVATGATNRVGLFDSEFTSSGGTYSGSQYSYPDFLAGGYAAGYSYRYSGQNQSGYGAWVANAATGATTRVGFFDAAYTQTGGYRESYVNYLTGGYAVGYSKKYSGANDIGQAAWVANVATGVTTRIGLFGSSYTQTDGTQISYPSNSASGRVAGSSNKYNGATALGQTAWVFNLQTQALDAITLSLRPSDGYEYSQILQLYDTGLAIGYYELFNGAGTDLGQRAFGWTPQDGAFDLASVVQGGISAAGWSSLTYAQFADPANGLIAGFGSQTSNANIQAAYVVTPEPGTAGLLAFGVLGLVGRRRRVRK